MDYIQPFTDWLRNHSEWALLLAFLISFAESLAIIGSIVPGSVMMTMVGILAGSGVMRIDLTLVAAVLGAIAGDGGSYFLGYVLSDRLLLLWPFKHHPKWLHYGKEYFERHGGKSIFFGRFIGPLRSIIPVIAGMMRMRHIDFLIANAISAVAWSLVYVGPGILIGAASVELSTESATRLFLLVIGILVIVWAAGLGIRWGWRRISHLLHEQLHQTWVRARNVHALTRLIKGLTPPAEANHAATAALVFLSCFFSAISVSLILWIMSGNPLDIIDVPLYFFVQSLRTQPFDAFFSIITLLVSPYPLLVFFLSMIVFTTYARAWHALRYWISLSVTCTLLSLSLNTYNALPPADALLINQPMPLFPASGLTFATAYFGFLILSIRSHTQTTLVRALRITFSSLLLLMGLALLYLGDNWTTGVLAAYCIGLTLCLVHWVLYRRKKNRILKPFAVVMSFIFFLCTAIGTACLHFKATIRSHTPYPQQYVLTPDAWWNQRQPLLPLYTTNRLGQPMGLLNIQYLGQINHFQNALESHGWTKQSPSFLQSVLLRTGSHPAQEQNIPLKTRRYLNQQPMFILTYSPPKEEPLLVLSLWRSNYHLLNYKQPLWLGSMELYRPSTSNPTHNQPFVPLDVFLSALSHFETTTRPIPVDASQHLPSSFLPSLFIIREMPSKSVD